MAQMGLTAVCRTRRYRRWRKGPREASARPCATISGVVAEAITPNSGAYILLTVFEAQQGKVAEIRLRGARARPPRPPSRAQRPRTHAGPVPPLRPPYALASPSPPLPCPHRAAPLTSPTRHPRRASAAWSCAPVGGSIWSYVKRSFRSSRQRARGSKGSRSTALNGVPTRATRCSMPVESIEAPRCVCARAAAFSVRVCIARSPSNLIMCLFSSRELLVRFRFSASGR